MKNTLLFLAISLAQFTSLAQNEFTCSWYYLTETSEVMILVPSFMDIETETTYTYTANEVVLLHQKSKGIYLGYDAVGRMIQVKGDVVQVKSQGRLLTINQDVAIDLDVTLKKDHAYWMTGVDSGTMTRKIELANGTTVSVKQELSETLDDAIKNELAKDNVWMKTE